MEVRIMKLTDIIPADYNPRKRLRPGDTEWEALKNSIEKFGLVEPLVVNATTGTLVSGHQRLNVLKKQGATEAEVVVVELTPEQEKLLNIAMNKIDGEWDYDKLEELFGEIKAEDIKYTGFSEDELMSMFGIGSGEDDDDYEPVETPTAKETVTETEDIIPEIKPRAFNIFLSFASKELAENWMKERGLEYKFENLARNITITMEGTNYGKGR